MRFSHDHAAGAWTAAFFLCFLAGATVPVWELAHLGGIRFSLPDSGLGPTALRLCLPAAVSCVLGFFACGVFLLPCWMAACGYVLSAPAAAAVQAGGTDGFLSALISIGLPGFAAVPIFFAVTVLSALCSQTAFRRRIGKPSGPRYSPLTPPFPLVFVTSFLLLLAISLCTAAF